METPRDRHEFATVLAAAGRARVTGGGTKLGWGGGAPEPEVWLSTAGLAELREHNAGDLTAVLEAGVPLAAAQERFASAGQMLALDPPLGPGDAATAGGVVAAGDSGPLRHRYGAARDLVVGITVALTDGTLARAGGKVIKNVAGYDLAKLFAGSFGTLGAIVEVAVRLHPLPPDTVTARGTSADPAAIGSAASTLAHERLELQCLDARWADGEGAVLARAAGAAPRPGAEHAARVLADAGLDTDLVEADDELWAAQRAGQRGELVVRVSGVQAQLGDVLATARALGGEVVGRAALGLSWVRLPAGAGASAVDELRGRLAPSPCVLLDAPAEVRETVDGWGPLDAGLAGLMARVKARFDPAGTLP
jgi:glycolate oxidase FAD binding subunit